jgi:hypothetical protein
MGSALPVGLDGLVADWRKTTIGCGGARQMDREQLWRLILAGTKIDSYQYSANSMLLFRCRHLVTRRFAMHQYQV